MAKGLFHQAIAQSGSLWTKFAPADVDNADRAYRQLLDLNQEQSVAEALLAMDTQGQPTKII